jgi:hypothetical protein
VHLDTLSFSYQKLITKVPVITWDPEMVKFRQFREYKSLNDIFCMDTFFFHPYLPFIPFDAVIRVTQFCILIVDVKKKKQYLI